MPAVVFDCGHLSEATCTDMPWVFKKLKAANENIQNGVKRHPFVSGVVTGSVVWKILALLTIK